MIAMAAHVIPFNNKRRARSAEPQALIELFQTLREKSGDLHALEKHAKHAKWSAGEDEIDAFALLLSQFAIGFLEPTDQGSVSQGAISDRAQETAQAIANPLSKRSAGADRFWRARRMSGLLGDALGPHDPIKVIERHLALFFDQSKRQSASITTISSESGEYAFFRSMAQSLAAKQPKNPKVHAILYFLSDPYADGERFSIADIRRLVKLESPYKDLVFTRFTFPCEDRLNPMPTGWTDLAWLYSMARTPFQMQRLVGAAFELRDELVYEPEDEIVATLNEFFERVSRLQEQLGGISLWDEEAATSFVFWFYSFTLGDKVHIDFLSRLCGVGQDYYEPEWPSFDEWAELYVSQARHLGYLELAQALVAYKMLDELLFFGRITHWPSLTSLLLELRNQPHYEICARAARLAADTLVSKGQPALALRLEAFAAPVVATPDKIIRFVIEGSKKPKAAEEIEARLIEHVGEKIWAKLKPQTKTWLIEADLNWSKWRFEGKEEFSRKDWSGPALQYCKALENEFVLSYSDLCLKAGNHDPAKNVTLGNVMMFLKRASKGEELQRRLLQDAGRHLPTPSNISDLEKLVSSYRNLAAHPNDFDLKRLDNLRRLLFSERVLRSLLEELL